MNPLMSSASLRNGRPAAGNRPPSPQPTSQIAALPTTSAMAAAQENHPSELITDACGVTDFSGALPKAEIQATQFLLNHPSYDGTGVVIAIFDTGVDPGAAGLQTTPDGRPKIIDVVDCTGSGDVNTSKVVTADENGCITGVLGRKLQVNPEWKNPSGEWRVGAKPAFDLFPGGLKQRIKEERKKKFDEQQRAAVTEATTSLAAFESANGGRTPASSPALVKQREELETKVKLLEEMAGKYEDQGPLVEAVVWNDGERWVAALDTSDFHPLGSEKGCLLNFGEPMTNFRDCRRFGTFSAEDACNYVVNIYDGGDTLSIVTDAGSHGTHVAGIASAYHPEDLSLNGIAPGAQIISCKIGDHRCGSMETMVGMTRALISVLENKADLVNMSYGEATSTSDAGRFIRLAEELVYKHDVIYVASAGNAGPALSTVGAPGGTSSAILGVGAFVTPALAAAGHSLREVLDKGTQYTWSSRGPTPDGDIGVNISAPGGAIAPVPQWSGQRMQLMNGTSMASPCACGGLALLLSALKAEGQPITPARVRRAVENTALLLHPEEPSSALTYGRGLLQVADALKYMQQGSGSHLDDVLRDMRLDVSVKRSDGATSARGIYLRDPSDARGPSTWSVEVKPGLKEDADVKAERLEIDLKLKVKSTVEWITAPDLLLLHHNGRSFEVGVDPTHLCEGLHYAEIQGFEAGAEWRGPLFRVPITVLKPLTPDAESLPVVPLGEERFVPGTELRKFVAVPNGATWAELKIKAIDSTTPKGLMVRATAIRPHTRYSDSEYRSYIQLTPRGESSAAFAVVQGSTLEVMVAQFWSSLGDCTLNMEIIFHGVEISTDRSNAPMVLDGAGGGTVKVIARAPLAREKIKPSAKLDILRIPLRPTDAALTPLRAPRDVLPGGRTIHSLVLTYALSLSEPGKVTPRVNLFNRYVYDSEIEAQMYFIRDANKQLLGVGDIYPESVTLKKGEYVIELHLRHEDPSLLETFKSLPIVVERKLDTAIQVPIYASNGDAVRGKGAITKERTLCAGESTPFFFGPVADDKLPKDATFGRSLGGSFALAVNSSTGKEAPGALAFTFIVPPKKADPPTAAGGGAAKIDAESALSEAVRDAQVKFLGGMKIESDDATKASYEKLLKELTEKHPTHLPLLREPLKRLSAAAASKTPAADVSVFDAIISAADAVLGAVDMTELAVFLAAKCPEEGEGAAEKKKEMEEKKGAVIEALAAKCTAILDKEALVKSTDKSTTTTTATEEEENLEKESAAASDSPPPAAGAAATPDEFEAVYAQLRRWVDPNADTAYAVLVSRREARAGRTALALRALDKAAAPEDKPAAKEVLERREELMRELGWQHWARVEHSRLRYSFPTW